MDGPLAAPADAVRGHRRNRSLSLVNPTSWITRGAALFPAGAPSDGTISVEETKHPDMSAFAEVDATHTFIMNHPRARQLVLRYLSAGQLD